MDETYIKAKGRWKYLYRTVDSNGNTLDFWLMVKRDAKAAKRFLREVLNTCYTLEPRVITVDKNPSYPVALSDLKEDKEVTETTKLRQTKYRNNIVEKAHRLLKRRVKPGLGFASFHTARRTLRGYEAMNMIRKGQVQAVEKGEDVGKISFIHQIFGVVA